ncbi:hypothetical protein ACIBQ6_16205 [Nonomuraea sp. NPDC049655]|uniref:hypothetical protein n=1 Tax=Nonomuraea sp. NPDC049655 TaxID=3364355 RepID=UPI0037A9BBBD
MRVTFATQAAPGRANEDFVAATPDAAVLLDGAGTPPGSDSGCSHGVAWYSRTLGSTLIASISQGPNPLPELVPADSVLVLDITGNIPADRVRAAALLSDGASRLVDRFHLTTWREALDTLDQHGPADLITTVRAAAYSDPDGERWPRGKTYDDATAAHISFTTTE